MPLLTPRHRQILTLIARGLTSRQIACCLRISRRTVDVHRTNLMRRLGARTINDATAFAMAGMQILPDT